MPVYTIYKIQCGDEVYIGSTRDFTQRKSQHKRSCNLETVKGYNLKIYQVIRENGGWDSKIITPIELLECETITEAHIREQFWIREYSATLNMRQAYITKEDRQKQKNIARDKWEKNHPEENREKRNKYQRERRALNLQNSTQVEEVPPSTNLP